jgi:bisphosphoglycerate-dependent phosphoglycerate mutase
MKSVLILRHAKSSWTHPELNDHDRPLNKRGKRDAPLIGELLKNEHLIPEFIISSNAKRADSTAKIVAKAAGYKGEIALNQSLYAAKPAAYIDVLRDLAITQMARAKVNTETAKILTGHSIGVRGAYLKYLEEDLLSEYLKAVDYLTIIEENRLKIKVTELTTKNETNEYIIKSKLQEKEVEIQKLTNSQKELYKQVQSLVVAFQNMTDQHKVNNAAQYLYDGGGKMRGQL